MKLNKHKRFLVAYWFRHFDANARLRVPLKVPLDSSVFDKTLYRWAERMWKEVLERHG